jgi:WD40 repeat protein
MPYRRVNVSRVIGGNVAKALFLTLCIVLVACGGPAKSVPSTLAQPLTSSWATTSVYVAEECAFGATACDPKNGFVQQLGGRAIADGVINPVALAFDNSGNLFVSNAIAGINGDSDVTVYAARTGRLLRTLKGYKGASYALAFSPGGELFVVSDYKNGCCDISGSVAVYAPGGTRPIRRLANVGGFPGKPAFDASGNFYQPNFEVFPGWIAVYAPRATTPFRIIQKGIGFPLQLVFDAHQRLYVLNGTFGGGSDVTVYAPGKDSPKRTITTGLSNSSAIALDSRGNLYVANRGEKKTPASVTVYAPHAAAPVRTIRTGIQDPIALAFDTKGRLYVANVPAKGPDTVTVYAPNSETPQQTYRLAEGATALAIP